MFGDCGVQLDNETDIAKIHQRDKDIAKRQTGRQAHRNVRTHAHTQRSIEEI